MVHSNGLEPESQENKRCEKRHQRITYMNRENVYSYTLNLQGAVPVCVNL